MKKNGKITAIIPVRSGSKRCNNKNIRPFGDTNLLQLRIDILKKIKEIDIIQVNSNCQEMLDIAKNMGVNSYKRDDIYSADDCNGEMLYKCLSEACSTEIMLIAFAPTPFITEDDYKECIKLYRNENCDCVLSMKNISEYMFHNKKPFNFDPLNTCKSQNLPEYLGMTFGITIIDTEFVRKYHSIWGNNPYFYKVDELKALDINTNFDFYICEQLYKNNIKQINDIDIKLNISDDIYLGAVYDALNMMSVNPVDYYINIKPKAGYSELIHGYAFTIKGRKINKYENYSQLDKIRYETYKKEYFINSPIILIDTNQDMEVAHLGDITCQIYKKMGAKGIITDGNSRDIDLIDKMKFPVFCEGINPIDALDKWAYTEYNIPIFIKNKNIYPNDYIFASKDGIIFIPSNLFNEFIINLHTIMDKERQIRKHIELTNIDEMRTGIIKFTDNHGRF